MKKLYVIVGCNGAGKTTASQTIFPEILDCKKFINADLIAIDISKGLHEKVDIRAGRIMLEEIKHLLNGKNSFAFETTLSARSYQNLIRTAQCKKFSVVLVFFWLSSIELAIERVKIRVIEGGHDVPLKIIERRYILGLINLFKIYLPMVDEFMIFDNSDFKAELIASKKKFQSISINNNSKWEKILRLLENYQQ